MPAHFKEIAPPPPTDPRDIREEEEEEDDFGYGDVRFAARCDGPEDMTDAQLEMFVDLMLKMMQWEPEKRASTRELLEHPFFDAAQK